MKFALIGCGRIAASHLKAALENHLEIAAFCDLDPQAIRALRRACPLFTSFHMSGKTVVESGMAYRKEGVPMGLPGLSEFEIWRTDEHKVRAAWEELHRL